MTFRPWAVAAVPAVAVLAAHGGAVKGTFHDDDRPTITQNLTIRSWQPLVYFTSPYAEGAEPGSAGFRPVTVSTFAINYALHRLDPSGYLLVNLLLHAVLSWMVFVVGRVLLRDDRWAAVSALLYALHPLNAESVNYVVARSSLLVALGSVVAVWAFLRRRDGGSRWWTAVGVSAFGLALFSEESAVAVTVPLAMLVVMDPSHRTGESAHKMAGVTLASWKALVPYALILTLYLVAWWTVVGANTEQRGHVALYPIWTWLELTGRSLLLWVWPWPLGIVHPLVFTDDFDSGLAVVLVVALAGLVCAVWWCWRRRPLVAWCVIWAVSGFLLLAALPWLTTKGLLQENRAAFSAIALVWLSAEAARGLGRIGRRVLARGVGPAPGPRFDQHRRGAALLLSRLTP